MTPSSRRASRAPRRARTAGPAARLARSSWWAWLACLLAAAPVAGWQSSDPPDLPADPETGAALRVWLLTAAPGNAVWERFGHNAIRVLDTRTGEDISYNWGIFDFQQVDFVPRFLRGRMLYMMAPFRTDPMIDGYLRAGRPVALQELDLTAGQKARLHAFLRWNALPENRDYFYDYFLDNCSTRARDALDRVLDGALSVRFAEEPTGTSYRFHTRRLTRVDPLVYTGMDLLLGTPGDQPVSVWEEMFLPMTLMEEIRSVRIPEPGGGARPLVLGEEMLRPPGSTAEAPRGGPSAAAGVVEPEEAATDPWGPDSPPAWLVVYLALGLAVGGTVAWLGARAAGSRQAILAASVGGGAPGDRLAGIAGGLLAGVWSLAVGLVGTILVLVLFTDHQFMAWNENLFLFTPLSLGLAVLAPVALGWGRATAAARKLGWVVVTLAVAGLVLQLLPSARQQNAIFFALALPVHLGLAWALERRARGMEMRRPIRPAR